MTPYWTDIDGWLSPAEGRALESLSLFKSVLEFGSFKGRSTVCIARHANSVTSIDWHHGEAWSGNKSTLKEFLDNIAKHRVAQKITTIVGRIEDVASMLADESFDLVFVDDDHSVEGVTRSTKSALRCVKPGGIIAWHDWDCVTVREGVKACGVEPTQFRETLAWMTVGKP